MSLADWGYSPQDFGYSEEDIEVLIAQRAARRGGGMTFGSVIKARRVELGLTQKHVADQALLSAQFLCDLETGRRRRPSSNALWRLAAALNLPWEVLAEQVVNDFAGEYGVRPIAVTGDLVTDTATPDTWAERRRHKTHEELHGDHEAQGNWWDK